MFTWLTMDTGERKVQEVDIYASLDEVLEAMSTSAWEDDSNRLVDWISD